MILTVRLVLGDVTLGCRGVVDGPGRGVLVGLHGCCCDGLAGRRVTLNWRG